MIPTGYRTQAADTQIDAEFVQFALWRRLDRGQKYALLKRVLRRSHWLILAGISQHFPDANSDRQRTLYILKRWGQKYVDILRDSQYFGKLVLEDPLWLAHQLAVILEALEISYYTSGSVASSLQGEVRYTEDLDLVVKLDRDRASLLVEAV